MRILDTYILKQFIRNFLFSLLCFIAIFILVDLFENLDKFIDKNLSAFAIGQYYIYFIPEILKLITPVGMLMATLFTISRLNNFSETTAVYSAGINPARFFTPLLVFGLIVTMFSIYFDGWIVPKSNSLKFNFERTYLDKNRLNGVTQNFHVQDSENHILSIGTYNEFKQTGTNASLQVFDSVDISRLRFRFDITKMAWDSARNEWLLSGISKRKFDTANVVQYSRIENAYASELPEVKKINLSPSRLIKRQLKPDEIDLNDLADFISAMEDSGQNVSRAKVDYYSKISFPFANLVVILFGISLTANTRKGSAALQFGISILIAFVYLGFIKVSQTFGYSGELNPVFTAWMANITFLLIAAVNLLKQYRLRK